VRIWTPERNKVQGLLVAEMYGCASGVPRERSAVLAGGLPGADKASVLALSGIDRSWYLTVSVDRILVEMAARDLIPRVPGLAPLEAADLAHTEVQYLAKRLLLRALADGRNVICDMTMASRLATRSWLSVLAEAGYTTSAVFIDISIEESVRRTDAMHRRGQEEYLQGRGSGGRFIPAEAIRALAGNAAGSPSGIRATLRQEAGTEFPAYQTGGQNLCRLMEMYWHRDVTLGALAMAFSNYDWPPTAQAYPDVEQIAGPAVDDPEPYAPGSFDDVTRAYDQQMLLDDEYIMLALAATRSARAF
jgi:predicted kinase